MSRSRRLLLGGGVHYCGQALVLILGLWTTPLVLDRLGVTDYGLWLVGQQILTYIGLIDIGVVALLPRDLAALAGRPGGAAAAEMRHLIGGTARLAFAQVPLVALAAGISWASLPGDWDPLRAPFAVVLIGFVLLSPLRLLPATLQGRQDFAFVSVFQTAGWLVNTCLSVGLLVTGAGLMSLAWGWLAGQAFPYLAYGLRVARRHGELLSWRFPPFRWKEARRHVCAGLWVTLNQVGTTLLGTTDIFLIGYLIGPDAVVPYSITSRLGLILGNQAQGAVQMSLPVLAEIGAASHLGRARTATSTLTRSLLLLSGLIVCGLLAGNGTFVGWWVGAEKFGGPLLNGLLLLVMVLRHWNISVVFTLFAFGYNRRIPLTMFADGALSLFASWILVRGFGPSGGPLGSMAGVCLISLPFNLRALATTLRVGVGSAIAPLKNWVFRFAIMAVAATAAGMALPPARLHHPSALGRLAAVGVVVAVTYCLVMWPVILQTPLPGYVHALVSRFRARIARLPEVPP